MTVSGVIFDADRIENELSEIEFPIEIFLSS